jgi:hypothetical protein
MLDALTLEVQQRFPCLHSIYTSMNSTHYIKLASVHRLLKEQWERFAMSL